MKGQKYVFALSMLGVVLSSTSNAAISGKDLEVSIPNFNPGFTFNAGILFLKPNAGNLNYVIYNKELPAQTPGWTEQELRPSYAPGFEVGGSYIYPEGRDLKLNWTHLYSNTFSSVTAPSASYFLGPDFQIGPNSIPIRDARGTAVFRYDVVNLDIGQYVNFGQHLQMRFFGGLSNTYLREEVIASYSGNVITGLYQGPFVTTQTVVSNFKGIGPRFGINANYLMDSGWGFMGEFAGSAMIGTSYTATNYLSAAPELASIYQQSSNSQVIRDQTVTQVIPGFDTKLGIVYDRKLQNNTEVRVEAGYQAAVYINAVNQYLPQTLVQSSTTGGIYVATMNHSQSNYSVQGPFLKATLRFNT